MPNAQCPTHNAQRTTHNAQRKTHGVCLHGGCRNGIAAGVAVEAEGCPAARSAAACTHTMQVSAWWSWCNPGALEGCSAAPPCACASRQLWGHANRRAGCQAAAPCLGAWNPSPAVRHARQLGWRLRIKASRQMTKLGLSDGFCAPAKAHPGTGAARQGAKGLRPAVPKLGRAVLEREAGAAWRWLSRRRSCRRPGRRRPGPPARCPRI
ncbi:UNVERIFIED_ORG: hypothetical protein HNP28_000294 [Comamonas terrigena]